MGMRYVWILLCLILLPGMAAAQQPADSAIPENTADSVQTNATPNQVTQNSPVPRRRRTIQNREFDDREKIILLLNAHCDFPSREDLLSTSPDVETLLQNIVEDKSLLLTVRMRAVEALAYFNTPMNRETLERILAHPEQAEHQLMVLQAIRSYAQIAPDQAPAVLAPFLADKTDFYRFVTISSLRNCPGPAALKVLKDRYDQETNRFFKMRLKQAIDFHCQNTSCSE